MAFFKALCLPTILLILLSCNLRALEAQTPEPVAGLSYTFHQTGCPQLESIVRTELTRVFASDIGQAAGLLRLHFHDCFVLGCDASVLLESPTGDETETQPNASLRAQAFVIIENLRRLVHNACNRTVSCADLTALAARDAVSLSGGPNYTIPLGRRDGVNYADVNTTEANLPAPTSNTSVLMMSLGRKGFTLTDIVALSGGHTIGRANCSSFRSRLFPARQATMDQTFYNNLLITCPTNVTVNTTMMDIRSPNVFDNRYYVDLMNRQTLFTSDQDLFTDSRTNPLVNSYAVNQTLFFENFVSAMIKMGQLNVTTGTEGEIRQNCSRPNPRTTNRLILPGMEKHGDENLASY